MVNDLYQEYANTVAQFIVEGEGGELKDAIRFFYALARHQENQLITVGHVLGVDLSQGEELEKLVDSIERGMSDEMGFVPDL